MKRLLPFAPVLLLALLVLAARLAGLQDYASFAALGQQQSALHGFVAARPAASVLLYVALYAGLVTLSLPLGGLMSAAGGLLFGAAGGAAAAVLGAWIGAVALFLLARTALGRLMRPTATGGRMGTASALLERVRPALQRDGFSALLALRLLPIVPFWLTNLAPALAGMKLLPYAAATLLGIAPATAVFASLGAGLGDTLAAGRRPDLGVVFSPHVLLPLLGLAALALAPIGWRRWRGDA